MKHTRPLSLCKTYYLHIFCLIVVFLCTGSGCANNATATKPPDMTLKPKVMQDEHVKSIPSEIIVENQHLVDNTIHIRVASSPKDGWLVIYQSINNTPGTILNHAHISKGTQHNISIKVRGVEPGDTLFARIHTDTKKIGRFEFPPHDEPLEDMTAVPFVMTQEKEIEKNITTSTAIPTRNI